MGRKLDDFGRLRLAEQKLVEEMRTGVVVKISPGVPRENAPEEHRIRASFIRYLARGGCDDCRPPEKGVRVQGAYIEGNGPDGAETRGLDLQGCRVLGDLVLVKCRFPDLIVMRDSDIAGSLALNASTLCGGLDADQTKFRSGVYLREVVARGIRLANADVAGHLDCSAALIVRNVRNQPGAALVLWHAQVGRSINLSRGFKALGAVEIAGARIGGDLNCSGGIFRGVKTTRVRNPYALFADGAHVQGAVFMSEGFQARGFVALTGAEVGGDISCDGGLFKASAQSREKALSLSRVEAKGALFLRRRAHFGGLLDLTGSSFERINDDPLSWPSHGRLALNDMFYRSIAGGQAAARRRLEWLSRQDPTLWGEDFWPQPYEQLAKVLRETGHEDEAKTVLVEKERLLRRAEFARLTKLPEGGRGTRLRVWIENLPQRTRNRMATPLLEMVGYGHRPERALTPALALVLLGWTIVALGSRAGVIEPVGTEAAAPRALVPLAYAFESFVPILDLGQKAAFRPDMATSGGWWLQVFLWIYGLLGWLIGGVAAAGVLGLFRRS